MVMHQMCFRATLFLTLLFQFAWVAPANDSIPVQKALRFFKQAEALYNLEEPTPYSDSLAINNYLVAAQLFPDTGIFSEKKFGCYINAGIIEQSNLQQVAALINYNQACNTVKAAGLPDSFLFKPYLFSGNAHYHLNHFDSAIHYFEQAETVLNRYHELEDAERLYNSLGAIYFQSGNFTQSANYFERALQILSEKKSGVTFGYYSFQSNIASALRRLEYYDSAAAIYRKLLPLGIQTEEISINIASIFLEQHQPDSAIYFLQRISNPEAVNPVIYYNHFAYAWSLKNELQRAKELLLMTLTYSKSHDAGFKNPEIGKTFRLLGRIEQKNGNYLEALKYYQQSMVAFEYEFNDTSILSNPVRFEQGFTSFELFESLYLKAGCWEELYRISGDSSPFANAINCYQSTYLLGDFIRTSFDNEEARLFLGKKVMKAYQQGIALMLDDYKATKNDSHLKTAFFWASKSKARALSILMHENEIKLFTGIPDTLLHNERDLKLQLSKLLQEKKRITDPQNLAGIQEEISKCQFELSRLYDQLNEFPAYYKLKHELDTLDFAGLQSLLNDQNKLLLSYFHTPAVVYVFGISGNQLLLHQFPNDSIYQHHLQSLINALNQVTPGISYQGSKHSSWLFNNLMEPLLSQSRNHSLIIIPQESLNSIPFEVLENRKQQYLTEEYQVAYQYSSIYINADKTSFHFNVEKSLAVAPFIDASHLSLSNQYLQLPASLEELQNLRGIQLLNKEATKQNFLGNLEAAGTVHLATHSKVDYHDPLQSYIAFYPTGQQNIDHRLFAHEIYNLNLQDKELVVLSSCETGSGKSAKGEGILSLSRAFAAAGCDNQVISLWKAEDIPTAYISRHFYSYLEKGNGPAAALRLAKLDLLKDPSMAQFHTPPYWGNLIFTGNSTQTDIGWKNSVAFLFLISIAVMAVIAFRLYSKTAKKWSM